MIHQLEKIVENLIGAIDNNVHLTWPTLQLSRSSMRLLNTKTGEGNPYSCLFEWLDLDNTDLKDLFQCCGAEIVNLENQIVGIRVGEHFTGEQSVFWLKANDQLRGTEMSHFYDQVTVFLESLPTDETRARQNIDRIPCGQLIPWRSVVNHIRNNPADAVFGNLSHPLRYFSSGTDLYVKARDRKDTTPLSDNTFLNASDLSLDEPLWFSVKRPIKNTLVL